MKSTVLDKLLLLVMAALLAAFGLLSACLAVRIVSPQRVAGVIGLAEGSFLYSLLFGLGGLLLCALALFAAIRCFTKRSGAGRYITVRKGEGGTLQLSMEAISSAVQQYCGQKAGVQMRGVDVTPNDHGAALRLALSFADTAAIPETSLALQDGLKAYLSQSCGLDVSGVDIRVLPPDA